MNGRTAIALPRAPRAAAAFKSAKARAKEARQLEEDLAIALREAELPGWPERPQLQKVEASVVLRFSQTRKRKPQAFAEPLGSALAAALRGGTWWKEGKWIRETSRCDVVSIELSADPGPPRTLITLEWSR